MSWKMSRSDLLGLLAMIVTDLILDELVGVTDLILDELLGLLAMMKCAYFFHLRTLTAIVDRYGWEF